MDIFGKTLFRDHIIFRNSQTNNYKMIIKNGIFVVYLGMHASCDKMDAKFVICDPKNHWGADFSGAEKF